MTIQRVKTKLRFLLGLLAQFLSQGSEVLRQIPFGICHLFRNKIFQSVHLLSYKNTSSVGSLCSTVISRFFATMDPSDSQRSRVTVIYSHHPLATNSPLRWVSQVPRLIFPRALSPITPGGPMAAFTRSFTIGDGLHHSLAGWPLSKCVTRPNRVHLRYGSRVRSAGLRPFGLLRGPPAPLPGERAINRVVPPFRLLDQPGLAWRTKATKPQRGLKKVPIQLVLLPQVYPPYVWLACCNPV